MPLTQDAVTTGTILAKRVAASRFRGDHARALRLMSAAGAEELAVGVDYLAGRLREALLHITDGEENLALLLLEQPSELDRFPCG